MFRYATALWAILLIAPAQADVIDLADQPALPRSVAISQNPDSSRDLVLLGADLVEIAVALGAADRILARPEAVDLPGLEDTPHKMREYAGVEGIASMRPGVVVASNARFEQLLAGLSDIRIPNQLIDRSLPATEKVTRMARLLELDARGEQLNHEIRSSFAKAQAITRSERPLRILHVSKQGAGGSFSAGGAGTGVDNLIRRVGAQNAAAAIGMDRYRSVTPEGVILMQPDVVLISQAELPAFGNIDDIWNDYPGLALTPAGRANNLIIMRDLHVRADAASSGVATLALAQALVEMFP
ncbi:ABC transporter substrate-binding protein [Paracoccus sp. Z330]|uniref:ABC transporter substrate-binding protein n=1 Tax=Paracoccus onchidii TaxID=3017813 RepID=A0ABT4ZDF6_9RHOB|nr:ABC transporter substrate-binding protein [Paracoccus onchidii]MDB6177393.1 ABC transporter substrate-binding protein [Paracoccus onchidii]